MTFRLCPELPVCRRSILGGSRNIASRKCSKTTLESEQSQAYIPVPGLPQTIPSQSSRLFAAVTLLGSKEGGSLMSHMDGCLRVKQVTYSTQQLQPSPLALAVCHSLFSISATFLPALFILWVIMGSWIRLALECGQYAQCHSIKEN